MIKSLNLLTQSSDLYCLPDPLCLTIHVPTCIYRIIIHYYNLFNFILQSLMDYKKRTYSILCTSAANIQIYLDITEN